MKDEHDWEKYLACMEELKRRTQIVRDALIPYWTKQDVSVPNIELACLQLRKMYELVAFAALAAHKPRYQEIRKKFEKDWKLPEIIRRINSINPGFLPVAFEDVDGNIKELEDRRFTPNDIIKWHAEFGSILHAFNPYKPQPDYRSVADLCGSHIDRFTSTLSRHKVNVIRGEVFYLVTMQSDTDGSTQVATFYNVEGALIKKHRKP